MIEIVNVARVQTKFLCSIFGKLQGLTRNPEEHHGTLDETVPKGMHLLSPTLLEDRMGSMMAGGEGTSSVVIACWREYRVIYVELRRTRTSQQ